MIRQLEKPPPLFFEHITRQEGLPAGKTDPLLRDSRGYLWLGNTSLGLLRYDGYTFQEFQDTADRGLEGRVFPKYMVEDRDGKLWLSGAEPN